MMSIENFTLTLMYVCIFCSKLYNMLNIFWREPPVGDKVNVSHDPMTHHADTDLVMTQEPPLDCPILIAIKQRRRKLRTIPYLLPGRINNSY